MGNKIPMVIPAPLVGVVGYPAFGFACDVADEVAERRALARHGEWLNLAEAIKGMQVRNWEVREHSNGKRVVYVRFEEKRPSFTVDVKEAK